MYRVPVNCDCGSVINLTPGSLKYSSHGNFLGCTEITIQGPFGFQAVSDARTRNRRGVPCARRLFEFTAVKHRTSGPAGASSSSRLARVIPREGAQPPAYNATC